MIGDPPPRGEGAFETRFAVLFESAYPSLFRYMHRLCGDYSLAADLTQEAFVKLYQRAALPDDPRSWLAAVANNLFRDERRRGARRQRLLAGQLPERTLGDAPAPPDQSSLDSERQRAVRDALDALPERDRQLLLLRYEGFSYAELARALDIPAASIGTILARARTAFQVAYAEREANV